MGKATFSRAIDRDVYHSVKKCLDDSSISLSAGGTSPAVSVVYDRIRRSNSSLGRRPKVLLEDSITRILDTLKEESSDDGEEDSEEKWKAKTHDDSGVPLEDSNSLNRSIARSLAPPGSPSKKPSTNEESLTDQRKRTTNGTAEKLPSRPAKRQKQQASQSKADYAAPSHVSLADVGGMDHVIEEFKEFLMLPLKRPQRYMQRGLKIPRGILLHGPPGCGKTLLCEAVAAELGLPFLPIAAPSVVSGMSGESEKQLRQHFEKALELAPCVMFIDEIDAITPKRESAQREMERRIVGQLLTCLDDLALEKTNGRAVIVLAATNRPDSLDPALRRAGRFDTEINIGVPNAEVREQILQTQCRRTQLASGVDFNHLARLTPGFVGADLESLIYKAGASSNARYLDALKKLSQEEQLSEEDAEMIDSGTYEARELKPQKKITAAVKSFRKLNKVLDELREPLETIDDAITMSDFLESIPLVQPSSKREGFATIPDTTWASVGALDDVRKQLQQAVVEPIKQPERYARFGISIPAGVLLWGPPGCGKTLLAKAVANESKANFISIKGPELLNKYVGESERAVRQVFLRAQSSVPCVIFFDELDALVPRRDDALSEASSRVVNTLLTELDGVSARSGIYVIAATNRPDMIDAAMLRPGRLGKHLYVGLPAAKERQAIMLTLLRNKPVQETDAIIDFAGSSACDGFSGADLGNLVYEAAQQAVERDAEALMLADIAAARGKVKCSVGDVGKYERLRDRNLTA